MKKLIKYLNELSEKDYQRFNQNIIKGNSPIIGVRIPTLRKIAKEIIKNNEVNDFFINYEGIYFEEKLIKGLILASNEKYFKKYNKNYLKELDSWCLVDTFCNSVKFIEKNKIEYWEYIKKLINSKGEFFIRTGYVLILNYYLNDDYIDEIIDLCLKKVDYYYVNMAIAWLLSTAYIKYPKKITDLLDSKKLTTFVQEKTIDKINDSFRVSSEDKRILRELKYF